MGLVFKSKCVMANLLLAVILLILLHSAEVAFAQYCEAPTIFENGVRKSTQITVHFKEKVFDLPKGLRQARIMDVASSFSQLRQHFTGLEKRYGAVSFIKQIPNAIWGDIWQRHKRTGELVRIHDMSQLFVVKFAQFVPIDSIISELERMPEVEYAHRPIEAISLADPNDPSYPSQWNLAKIDAAKAWDITTGTTNIIVGIVEDGQGASEPGLPDKNHNDFYTGSGTTGDSKFVSGKGDIGAAGSHATGVAGVIGAATNDGDGVASLGWNIKMIPYRFTAYTNGGDNLVAKIDSARSQGCDVINCSFVTRSPTSIKIGGCNLYTSWNYPSVATAIVDAIAAGIIVVGGTGNTGLELTGGDCSASQIASRIPYIPRPAAYPNVIAVSATDVNDVWAGGRAYNYGADFEVDVAAPGISVTTTAVGQTYQTVDGTSFATPHVSALAGLITTLNPQLLVSDVTSIIRNTALDVNQSQYPGYDDYMGYGRINAYQALLLTHAYSNKSMSSGATAFNNGRRLAIDGNGAYHLIFESGISSGGATLSEIFYRSSADGVNWSSTPIRLSAGNEQNQYPTIVERSNKLYVVWQRKTGANIYDILFRHYNGSSWEAIQTITTGISLSSDPIPVIAISAPTATFEMMVAYRTGSGLKSRRSTSINGAIWGAEITMTSSTGARLPSLAYRTNEAAYFQVTWDDGYNIFHRKFNGTTWNSETNVSSGLGSSANTHSFSSFAISGNNNQNIVWHAYDPTLFNNLVVFHNLNLNPTVYTKFYSGIFYSHYTSTNVSGLAGGSAAVFWEDSNQGGNKNIRKAQYNGSTWVDGSAGTIYGTNGIYVSGAVRNPAAGSIKAVWRGGGSQTPFTLNFGSSLSKSVDTETIVYSRQLIYASTSDSSVLALRLFAPQITGENTTLTFPAIFDNGVPITASLDTKLTFDFVAPANAVEAKLDVGIYARDAANLLQVGKPALQIGFELIDVVNNNQLALAIVNNIALSGKTKTTTSLSLPLAATRGRMVRIRPFLSGLDLGHVRGALVHEYGAYPATSQKEKPTVTEAAGGSHKLSLRVHPNPFNPSTQIHFSLPEAGVVSLRIYDINGRLVRQWHDEQRRAGEHAIVWDGNDQQGRPLTSGTYFSEFVYGSERRVARMVLLR